MESENRLIDANALKSKVWPEEMTGEGFVYVEDIDNAPTVDAAPVVHGQWERCFEDWRHQFEGDQCSACKFQIYGGVSHFKYCPNCGAKMDGGVSSD